MAQKGDHCGAMACLVGQLLGWLVPWIVDWFKSVGSSWLDSGLLKVG